MNLSLKKILKEHDVLFISEIDDSYRKIESVLKLFFKKTFHTNSTNYANNIYEKSFPNVIVIDIELSDSNGIEYIKEFRKRNKTTPIIIVTKNIEINNLIASVKLNLIDYILKPIDINKLIYALNQSAKQIINNGEIKSIIKKGIKYNYLEKSVLINDKKEILTKNESRLLELFLINKNKFLKNEDITNHIWSEKDVSESAFKSLINRLTKKIGKDTINNSFGIGYGIFD